MVKEERFYQCRFTRFNKAGNLQETIGWAPERAAKVGLVVEILSEDDPERRWTVSHVYQSSLLESTLKETQRLNRNSLPSIRVIE